MLVRMTKRAEAHTHTVRDVSTRNALQSRCSLAHVTTRALTLTLILTLALAQPYAALELLGLGVTELEQR